MIALSYRFLTFSISDFSEKRWSRDYLAWFSKSWIVKFSDFTKLSSLLKLSTFNVSSPLRRALSLNSLFSTSNSESQKFSFLSKLSVSSLAYSILNFSPAYFLAIWISSSKTYKSTASTVHYASSSLIVSFYDSINLLLSSKWSSNDFDLSWSPSLSSPAFLILWYFKLSSSYSCLMFTKMLSSASNFDILSSHSVIWEFETHVWEREIAGSLYSNAWISP